MMPQEIIFSSSENKFKMKKSARRGGMWGQLIMEIEDISDFYPNNVKIQTAIQSAKNSPNIWQDCQ